MDSQLWHDQCDCGPQLQKAMKMVEAEGKGVVIYLSQEGRGIGLLNKIKAYNFPQGVIRDGVLKLCRRHKSQGLT